MNRHKSSVELVRTGVPQGSVLGLLLFLIYVNDIRVGETNSNLTLFADDCNLVHNDILAGANEDVNMKVESWSKNNRLTLKRDKTVRFNFWNQIVESGKNSWTENFAKSGRYLGMEIDNELKFDIHCEKLLKRASKVASIFYHMRAFFNSNQLYKIYRTYIQSIYQYGVLIYGTANKSISTKIEKQQKMINRNSFD